MAEMERVIYTPSAGPPQGPGPNSAIYGIMGEANIFRMILDFYAELEKSEIRRLFPSNMEEASKIGRVLRDGFGRPTPLP